MSLHSHVNSLNDLGNRLASLTERARMCADALEGSRPESVRERDTTPTPPVSSNLDARFSNVGRQFEEVINQLAASIDRIEQNVMDQATGLSASSKSVVGY